MFHSPPPSCSRPIGNTFWISTGGRLIKVALGDLTIELLKSSGENE